MSYTLARVQAPQLNGSERERERKNVARTQKRGGGKITAVIGTAFRVVHGV